MSADQPNTNFAPPDPARRDGAGDGNDTGTGNGSSPGRHAHPLLQAIGTCFRILLKTVFALVVIMVTFVVAVAAFFFLTPEIDVPVAKMMKFAQKYVPDTIQLDYEKLEIKISRPEPGEEFSASLLDRVFAKHLTIKTTGLCVQYEGEAVDSCFATVRLGATAGWGGKRLAGERGWMPRLISIDPAIILAGDVGLDLTKFPASDPNAKPSKFSVVDLLRTQILPKWHIEGSRLELGQFDFKTATEGYHASFDLTTQGAGETIKANLEKLKTDSGAFAASGIIRVRRPEQWIKGHTGDYSGNQSWKVYADAELRLKKKGARAKFKADANIYDWQTLDLRLGSHLHGISALREARIEMAMKKSDLNGKFSVKVGGVGSEVRGLNFVNCAVDANLDRKVGGLRCGPQAVKLQLRERGLIHRPDLFTLAPDFDLRVSHLEFGDKKAADFAMKLNLEHLNMIALQAAVTGRFEDTEKTGLRYQVDGTASIGVDHFANITRLLLTTPYSVPAPLNRMNGPTNFDAKLSISQLGGRIDYHLTPTLDSKSQAMHLRLVGLTELSKRKSGFHPATDMTLFVDQLHLSIPRLDLAKPPQLKPDNRFHEIQTVEEKPAGKKAEPADFRIRVLTSQPHAIQLATNLTKSVIPIDADVRYINSANRRAKPTELHTELSTGEHGPAAERAGELAPIQPVSIGATSGVQVAAPIIKGYVNVGETKLNLFRRDTTLERLRVDLLPNGEEKINGRARVHYLDYDIAILLAGDASHPDVKFLSKPPLEQRKIIAVLLFGKPMDELDNTQQQSVAGMQAAVADAALSVGSLYFLANTPIESIGYDPQKQFTATVGLGGGASMKVGSNADVGFRKSLGHDFVFRSDVDKLGDTGSRTVTALIEWVKGF